MYVVITSIGASGKLAVNRRPSLNSSAKFHFGIVSSFGIDFISLIVNLLLNIELFPCKN